MKARELIKVLKKRPDAEVQVYLENDERAFAASAASAGIGTVDIGAKYTPLEEKEVQWLVKDKDGESISVFADSWTCGVNGLAFYVGSKKVACFASWQHFRKVVTNDTQRCNQRGNKQ